MTKMFRFIVVALASCIVSCAFGLTSKANIEGAYSATIANHTELTCSVDPLSGYDRTGLLLPANGDQPFTLKVGRDSDGLFYGGQIKCYKGAGGTKSLMLDVVLHRWVGTFGIGSSSFDFWINSKKDPYHICYEPFPQIDSSKADAKPYFAFHITAHPCGGE